MKITVKGCKNDRTSRDLVLWSSIHWLQEFDNLAEAEQESLEPRCQERGAAPVQVPGKVLPRRCFWGNHSGHHPEAILSTGKER